jgi:hypothetical protein
MHSQFWLEYPKLRDHFKDVDIEGTITSGTKSDRKFIGYEVFWINLAENRRQWRTVMIIVCLFVCLSLARQPPLGLGHLIHKVSRSHKSRTTVGRAPLDE